MTTDLVVQTFNQGLSPADFGLSIDIAQAKAKRLTIIVEDRKLYLQIGDKKHLQVEAWQILGMGYGLTVKSQVTELLRDAEGNIIGVKASAAVVNGNGIIVGGGESYCFAAEQGKGQQTVSQLAGMAQTRACSRAFRQILSWVAELAGYAPTPAEEMHGELKERLEGEAKSKYHCQEHDAFWFKRGNMRGYAHPIDGGGWCNMPETALKTTEQDNDWGPMEESANQAKQPPSASTAGAATPASLETAQPTPAFASKGDVLTYYTKPPHNLTRAKIEAQLGKTVGQATREELDQAVQKVIESKRMPL